MHNALVKKHSYEAWPGVQLYVPFAEDCCKEVQGHQNICTRSGRRSGVTSPDLWTRRLRCIER